MFAKSGLHYLISKKVKKQKGKKRNAKKYKLSIFDYQLSTKICTFAAGLKKSRIKVILYKLLNCKSS
ncbi:hypothetical protein SAMN06298211_101359 [Prevotellaceae bacterium MN60]|nr:hypothetical protein SAMN06298211_101359 [Prevotellaceae bacterium MN60]